MTASALTPPPVPAPLPAAPTSHVLRRLFLTLFLRGRSSRGLNKEGAPSSIWQKLFLTIGLYTLIGLVALGFIGQKTFSLALYLHGMTFVFLGMYVAASAGEVLFNKEEADILLHRPIEPRALLWAKVRVMAEVSFWLALGFNFAGFFVGIGCSDGGLLFPLVHVFSTFLEALFCCGIVVLVYQLCLRWFGRERLEGLMTLAQMVIAIGAVTAGQIMPRLLNTTQMTVSLNLDRWWIALLPPSWFAGLDDALAGSHSLSSWLLAVPALLVTALVLGLAFGKLSRTYESGLQALTETASKPKKRRSNRRFLNRAVQAPPLRWWLRDPVSRASFLLTAAYLFRDRETKLRVYPGLAPMLVLPFVFLLQDTKDGNGWGIAFMSGYLGIIPMLGLSFVRYSQHWQAADIFRCAPMNGPAPLCHGARRAVLVVLTIPLLLMFAAILWFFRDRMPHAALVLPGLLALPIYALIPCLSGEAVPFSLPSDEAKSAGRGLRMIGAMLASVLISVVAATSWSGGWFWWLVAGESALVTALYIAIRFRLAAARWPAME